VQRIIVQDADAEIKRKKHLKYARFFWENLGMVKEMVSQGNQGSLQGAICTDFAERPFGPLALLLGREFFFFLNGLRFGVQY
jgi:hypothetical protein